jgi:hypothetical protein
MKKYIVITNDIANYYYIYNPLDFTTTDHTMERF